MYLSLAGNSTSRYHHGYACLFGYQPAVKTQTISRRVVLTALGRVGAALYMVGLSVGCSNEPPQPSVSLFRSLQEQDRITSLAWSPNGKHIVSGSADSTVMEGDAFTGQTVTNYTGHSSDIGAVAWSPDGKYIASGGVDKKILIWKVQKEQ